MVAAGRTTPADQAYQVCYYVKRGGRDRLAGRWRRDLPHCAVAYRPELPRTALPDGRLLPRRKKDRRHEHCPIGGRRKNIRRKLCRTPQQKQAARAREAGRGAQEYWL